MPSCVARSRASSASPSSLSLSRENLDRLLVQARIAGGEDAPASARVAALPGRDHAAGALDDRDQRHDVEILEPRFDHEIDLAESEQTVIVAVAAEAPEAHGACERGKAGLLLLGLEQVRARGGEQGFAQVRVWIVCSMPLEWRK